MLSRDRQSQLGGLVASQRGGASLLDPDLTDITTQKRHGSEIRLTPTIPGEKISSGEAAKKRRSERQMKERSRMSQRYYHTINFQAGDQLYKVKGESRMSIAHSLRRRHI